MAKPAASAVGAKAAFKSSKKARKKAKRYEKKGKRAYKKKRWDEAIVSFELAYGLHPEPRYLFNIGRCYEQMGDLFKAMEYVHTYVDVVQDEGEREDAAEVREILRAKLARTSGEVRIESQPAGAMITLQGVRKVQGKAPLATWLEAGAWEVEVALKDHETRREELVVQVGDTLTERYELTRKGAKPVATTPEAPDLQAKSGGGTPQDGAPKTQPPETARTAASSDASDRPAAAVLPHALFWSGVAGMAAGAVFGWKAAATEREVQSFADEAGKGTLAEARSLQDAAESQALAANVLYGMGAVGALAGAWLLLTSDTTADLRVGVRPDGAFTLRGSWP